MRTGPPPQPIGPGYSWDPERMMVQNMDAVLYFIGGGAAQYQHPRDGIWLPIPVTAPNRADAISFFKRYQCRPLYS
jgi:hypothetical protein